MRRRILPIALAVIGALPSAALAQVLGTDGIYTITKVGNGSFTTISNDPSAVRLTTAGQSYDDINFNVNTAAAFNYYGTNYNSVNVSTNGLVTFGGVNTSFTNTALSAVAPPLPSVAAYWDDLIFDSAQPGAMYALAAGNLTTIEWNRAQYFGGGAAVTTTFQMVLNSLTGAIQLNYFDTSGPPGQADGGSATVGVKGVSTFVQAGFNQAGTVVNGNQLNVTLNPVPEPGTLTLCGLVVAGGIAKFRRRKVAVA